MIPFQIRDKRCGKTITAPILTEYELLIENFLSATSAESVMLLIDAIKNRNVINFFKQHISRSVFKDLTKSQMLDLLQHALFKRAFETADEGDTLVLTIGNAAYKNYSSNGG